jgi:DNA-binding CsgD family transcriptional regulator
MNTSQAPSEFLLAILEGFLDGILVLTDEKKLLYINHTAHQLCQRLTTQNTVSPVPPEVWQICQALIERQARNSEKLVVMESEIGCTGMTLRVRVQWLSLTSLDRPCILIRLQDQQQTLQTLAIAEAQNWHLTEREAQVWTLRRSGRSRKQIASELFISEDTVKKHLGNIRPKRQSYLDEADWQLHHSHSAKHLCSA